MNCLLTYLAELSLSWSAGSSLHQTLVGSCRLSCSKACGILAPCPGMEPVFLALQSGFLTTGSSGKSPYLSVFNYHLCEAYPLKCIVTILHKLRLLGQFYMILTRSSSQHWRVLIGQNGLLTWVCALQVWLSPPWRGTRNSTLILKMATGGLEFPSFK